VIPPALMVCAVEARYPGTYYNPARWGTADGYMPFPVFREYAEGLWPLYAQERLNLAAAIGLALAGKEKGPLLAARTLEEAYPGGR
jgi:hypothetical protein